MVHSGDTTRAPILDLGAVDLTESRSVATHLKKAVEAGFIEAEPVFDDFGARVGTSFLPQLPPTPHGGRSS